MKHQSRAFLRHGYFVPALAALALAALSLAAFRARAHSAGADAYVVDDAGTVVVEGWMGGGDAPSGGKVVVELEDGTVYKTGDLVDGSFSFKPDRAERFKIYVDMGHGHGKTFKLHPDEFAKLKESLSKSSGENGPDARAPGNADSTGDAGNNGMAAPGKDSVAPKSAPRVIRREGSKFVNAMVGLLVIAQLVSITWIYQLHKKVSALEEGPPGDA